MSDQRKPKIYRDLIDALVRMCREGQGQIGAERARKGIWNRNATEDSIPEQHQMNLLLSRMSPEERQVLSTMLEGEVRTGVFETLKALEEFGITPFKDGYEGSPYNDFIGRLDDWKWPEG